MESPRFYLGRYEVLIEQIRDALIDIGNNLEGLNKRLDSFEDCIMYVEEGQAVIRVSDVKTYKYE